MKTIKLKSRRDILNILNKKGIRISKWANDIIPKIELTDSVENAVK
jgi:hypothetical protein